MAMVGYWSARFPSKCIRSHLLFRCNSTVTHMRRTALPLREHPTRTLCAPHFMGTWTDRIKRRWQSGNQTQDTDKSKGAEQELQKASGGGGASELEQTLKGMEAQIKANEEKIKDLQDKYLRALAEAENTRTRLTRQIEDAKHFGIQDFSKDVIEVADILDKAVESVKPEDLKGNSPLVSLFEGLKLTEAELHKVMSKNGLQKIEEGGVDFDPNIHEALFEVSGDKHGTVGVVSRIGYILNGRTIRPARVGVVKGPDS